MQLGVQFAYDGQGLGKGGTATLSVDGAPVVEGRIEKRVPFVFSMSGEPFDVGIDTCAPVGPYPHEFPFTGVIDRVEIDVATMMDELTPEQLKQLAAGMHHAASASQ